MCVLNGMGCGVIEYNCTKNKKKKFCDICNSMYDWAYKSQALPQKTDNCSLSIKY